MTAIDKKKKSETSTLHNDHSGHTARNPKTWNR